MKKLVIGLYAFALVVAFSSVPVFAAGQPNQSCQAEPSTPGGSATAPGSAFNTSGVSGGVYAGTQPQNSNNPMSVSQYDVACYQVSNH